MLSASLSVVQVHDIEDLARIGSRHKACPYFAARHLADTAELVFCPYSYLLDPNIRRATKVSGCSPSSVTMK
jgi:Fanconi anemia group J protein